MSEARLRRLNWGCGGAGEPGWINADRRQGAGIQLCGDIRDGLALESDSVDYAVSVHALQEVPFPELVPVLQELRRVLKPGGVLRLCLPDLEKGLRAYGRGDASHFLVPDEDARSLGGKFIVHMLWYSHSRILFTGDFIEELLTKAGYREVRHCACHETHTSHPGIVALDNREQESLFVEATK
jgi:predicted SAM-dependent methyltransferase